MRRKIRKKRQIRLQNFKEQRERKRSEKNAYDDEVEMLEDLLHEHSYFSYSDFPNFIFIYVDFHYGWELYRPKKIVFLYDQLSHRIDYCRFIFDVTWEESRPNLHVSSEKIGYMILDDTISFDDMLNYNPPNLTPIYDTSRYEIYIKSGSRKRLFGVKSEYVPLYTPYAWLFKLFDKLSKDIPKEFHKDGKWVEV